MAESILISAREITIRISWEGTSLGVAHNNVPKICFFHFMCLYVQYKINQHYTS